MDTPLLEPGPCGLRSSRAASAALGSLPGSSGHSPDPQAFSIGQDREGCTQGPLGADEHDPAGRCRSEQVAGASGRESLPARTWVVQAAWGVQGTGEPVHVLVLGPAGSLQVLRVLHPGASASPPHDIQHRKVSPGPGRQGQVLGRHSLGGAGLWRVLEAEGVPRGHGGPVLSQPGRPAGGVNVPNQTGREVPRAGTCFSPLGPALPCPAPAGETPLFSGWDLAPALPEASPELGPAPQPQHEPVTLGVVLGGGVQAPARAQSSLTRAGATGATGAPKGPRASPGPRFGTPGSHLEGQPPRAAQITLSPALMATLLHHGRPASLHPTLYSSWRPLCGSSPRSQPPPRFEASCGGQLQGCRQGPRTDASPTSGRPQASPRAPGTCCSSCHTASCS